MKKKLFSVFLAVALAATVFVGCGKTDTKATDTKQTIAFAWSYTSGDFFQALSGFLQGVYKDQGFNVELATAEGDADLQIQQVENFITMGVDAIVIAPVDNTGIADAVKKAVDAGIPVISFTSEISTATTNLVSADEAATGAASAQIAIGWLDKEFASAANGSVDTAVIIYSGDEKGVARSQAMVDTIKTDKKVNLVKIVESAGTDNAAGQSVAENLFTTNPNVKVIIAYNASMANGVNSYVMSGNSGITDKSKIGVFAVDESDEVKANIQASANNEAVVRGTISLGGFGDILADLDAPLKKLLAGKTVEKLYVGKLIPITAENVADFITAK